MILEILNYLACGLTIWGTYEISKPKPNTIKTNLLYLLSCWILIPLMIVFENIPMVVMYILLMGFAIRGIIIQRKQRIIEL